MKTRKNSLLYRTLSALVALAFLTTAIIPPHLSYAQTANLSGMLAPGVVVTPSVHYNPPIIVGMTIHPENPLQFDFIIDTGDDHLQSEKLRKESNKLINYFMATLTVPENEMWVNLSPYEKNKMIADGLSKTELGRDMLIQDYMLKQFTASLMHPEEKLGREVWKKIYKKSQAKFGTIKIPTNIFNKVWIVPEEAEVYVNGTNVFVTKSHLKVMLEEDYWALENNLGSSKYDPAKRTINETKDISQEAKEAIREIIIPEIEKEVNEGRNFSGLRQIYNSMILASWYKKHLSDNILGKVYLNRNKLEGIDLKDSQVKEKIYNQYIAAFKRGVYNYVKEDYDPATQEIIPRKYFSGGLEGVKTVTESTQPLDRDKSQHSNPLVKVSVNATLLENDTRASRDNAMSADSREKAAQKQQSVLEQTLMELELQELIGIKNQGGQLVFYKKKGRYTDTEKNKILSIINDPDAPQRILAASNSHQSMSYEYAVQFLRILFDAFYTVSDYFHPDPEYLKLISYVNYGSSLLQNQNIMRLLREEPRLHIIKDFLREYRDTIDPDAKPEVLIIGPGTGTFIDLVLQLLPNARITAIDSQQSVVDSLRLRFQNEARVHILKEDATEVVSLNNKKFDLILTDHLLKFVSLEGEEKLSRYARQLSSLIKDDGYIFNLDAVNEPAIENKFATFLYENGIHFSTHHTRTTSHRHTMFFIMAYYYFELKHPVFRDLTDRIMGPNKTNDEILEYLYDLAGYTNLPVLVTAGSKNGQAHRQFAQSIRNSVEGISSSQSFESLAVSLTSYCPVQCAFCFMSATPNRSETVQLNDQMIDRTIRYMNSRNFLRLELTGGEPLSEMEKVLKFIRETNVATIYIFTSGYFASNPEKTERVLDQISQALKDRERLGRRPAELLFRVSVDNFHERVPLAFIERIVHQFEQHHDTKYKDMKLGLKGIVADDDPILTIAEEMDAQIEEADLNSAFPLKKFVLPSGYAFNVYYGEIKLVDAILDADIEISKAGRIYSERLKEDPLLFSQGSDGILLSLSHNGNFSIHEYVVNELPIANISDKNFGDEIDERLMNDPFILVLVKRGISAVIDMLRELNREDVITKSLDANNQFLVVTEIMKDQQLKREIYRKSLDFIRQENLTETSPDKAQLVQPGGIDLNARHLNLKERGQSVELDHRLNSVQNITPSNVNGILPVIINITPIVNLTPLLGQKRKDDKNHQS